jgi:D-amino-acid dehydrogenase
MKAETIVVGAGIVGVSTAVQLARRGHPVTLIDRRPPGEETSFGNAGMIQREGVRPRAFPLHFGELFRYGLNQRVDVHYHLSALPSLAPFLARYWWHSQPERYERIVRLYSPLIARSLQEHAVLISEAQADDLIVRHGWYQFYRSTAARDAAYDSADDLAARFGIAHEKHDGRQFAAAQPGLTIEVTGAIRWTDPATVSDPHALTMRYFSLFTELGGRFVIADATTLARTPSGKGWVVTSADGPVTGQHAVIALGAWSDGVTRRLGYRLPLAVKRGYCMHYEPVSQAPLRHWIMDAERGYLLAPMRRGIRLTTGAEFASRDAPPTPVQLDRAEHVARALLPVGPRLDATPWMGVRPCTPDMMPIIGPAPAHPNLWFAFGHAHHGLTLGPATGRLIAEMIGGETPFVDPTAFGAQRFRPVR